MSERKFEELSVEEQHNEILKAIHNRLSEISISLEFMVRNSSFIDDAGFSRFQREWTRYMELSKGIYDEEDEAQEGETD